MGLYYDEVNIYGIKWSLIIETPVYKHTTIFEKSQINPLTEDANEQIRAAFLGLSEEEKEKYRFYFYKQGTCTHTHDNPANPATVFYTWVPCSVFEVQQWVSAP